MRKSVVLFILISSCAFSQSISDYQYVIVPLKFEFFKKEDQYRLNTLTKLLLQKYGFKAYFSNEEIPMNIVNQRCDFLYADFFQDNNFIMTKVKIILKDCKNKVVYETPYGKSREKEFATAYNEAFRDAGKSFDKLNYKYNGKNDILIVEKNLISNLNIPVLQENEIEIAEGNLIFSNSLIAETIENGFLLIDQKTSTIVLKLYKTSNDKIFIASSKGLNGIVTKKGTDSFFEYYKDKKLVSEKLNVCCI